LGLLIEQATNDIHTDSPIGLYEKVLDLINSRVDMYPPFHLGPNTPSTLSPNVLALRVRR
jgi:hypothetical protein